MIVVTGTVTARAESFDLLLREGLAHTHRSRGEDGCISHEVAIDCDDPLRLIFLERWRDRAALEAHFRVPASGDFVALIREHAAELSGPDIYPVAQA
jgi:quinol monooxygenase YgiN